MPPKKKWEDEEESSSEEESVSPPPVNIRRKFDDEEDEEVADNWEEAEDSEAEREKAAKAAKAKAKTDAEALANKKSKAQRIEEHREAARRRRAAEEEEDDSSDEDEADKKARLRESEKNADLKHAEDLLGSVGIGSTKARTGNKATIIEDASQPGQAIDLSKLQLFRPVTKSQFETLSSTLVPLIASSSTKPQYSLWLADFVKKIAADLPSTEIKKAASALTALSNEKMKEEKAAEKGGKRSKAAKSKTTLAAGRDVGRGVADTTSYAEEMGDDDFM